MPSNSPHTALLINRLQKRRRSRPPLLPARLGIGLTAILLVATTLGAFALVIFYSSLTADLPSPELIPAYFDPQFGAFHHPSQVLDQSGEHTLLTLDNPGITAEYRVIDPDERNHLSPHLVRAAVAWLQPDFWQSPGFSFRHLTDPNPHTIAERLVLDLMVPVEEANLRRALRMRLLAAQLVSQSGRAQVLEWYLNEMNFGHLAFGAGEAARLYLGQDAADLDLAGSSLLLAILGAPALNPLDAPSAALERQQQLLLSLHQTGSLSTEEYESASNQKLVIQEPVAGEVRMARAFIRLVVEELYTRIGQERLERGGWMVRTSLDYDLQMQLTCTLQAQIIRLESGNLDELVPLDCPSARLLPTLNLAEEPVGKNWSASAVLLDPQSGQVLALAGDTTVSGESTSLAEYPAGTLLGPLAAVGLFAGGYSPATLTWDIPASLPVDLKDTKNPDELFHGPERLRTALANDHLAGLIGLLEQNGAENIWRKVEPLGIMISSGSQALLGAESFNPLQMAWFYAPLANNGVQVGRQADDSLRPLLILDVTQNGQVQADGSSIETRALLSPQLAYLVQNVMADEPARRLSLGYPNPLEIGRPAGAKVGQTATGDDVWAAGFTPQRVAVVRVSRTLAEGETRLDDRLAAGVWHALMQTALRNLPTLGWSEPAGISTINVCNPSGLLPTINCPEVVSEIFLSGNEPSALDDLYQKLQINRETGLLATVFTPASLVEERTYFIVPPAARDWAAEQGLEQPPQSYDLVSIQPAISGMEISIPEMFARVSGEVEIRGTADLAGMQSYTVQVGQGMNPSSWLEVGSGTRPVKNDLLATWKTPAEDGLYAIRLLVVDGEKNIETLALQVTVDNTAPFIRIIYPSAGEEIRLAGKTLILAADIKDALGISKVEWLVDGRLVGSQTSAPFTLTWTASQGEHSLVVRAVDLAGNQSKSPPLTFLVK